MNKFDPTSHNITEEQKAELKKLFPGAFTEQGIDFDRLKTLLGEAVETGPERYSFTWPGKTEAIRAAQATSMGMLVPDKASSVDWDTTENLYLEGDNLEILKLLQKSYTGKVKMIYIDPPYNTGKDFVYPDKYGEGLKTYLEYTGQIDGEGKKLTTNTETDGRYHSKWLNMMYPRLMLARNLLKEDGVIFVSIDDHEVHNLRRIMDEIYGPENFVACISRRTKVGGGSAAKWFAIENDYVIVYLRNYSRAQEFFAPYDEEYLTRFKEVDSSSRFYWDTFERSYTATKPYTITAPDGTVLTGSWFKSKESFERDYSFGDIRFIKKSDDSWSVQIKTRPAEGRKVRSLLVDNKFKSSQDDLDLLNLKEVFDFPKPVSLIKELLSACTKESDIILDFFSGSATTAHAILNLNAEDGGSRRFILTQLQETAPEDSEAKKAGFNNIAEIGRERIKRAANKVREEQAEKIAARETPLDTGFKVYRLMPSTFNVWNVKAEDDLQQKLVDSTSLIKGDAKEEDVLTELILKSGYGLAEKTEEIVVSGKKFHSVAGGKLIVSLESGLTLEQVRAIAERKPAQFVTREVGFASDDILTNTAQIMKDKGIDFRVL